MALAANSSADEVPRDRLLNAVRVTLHKTALTVDLIGLKDDSTTSILHAMLKAAFVFVADKEDRAKLDEEDVVGDLGRKLQENQLKLGSLIDILLSAVGEALHFAAVKWPREDLKSTSDGAGASAQCDIPSSGGNLGDDPLSYPMEILSEVIDHPIDTADEEKAIPFLPPTDFPPEAEEQERDVAPMYDDAMVEEGAWRTNLIDDSLQRSAMEQGTKKEEKYEEVEFDGSLEDHSDDEEEHEPISEGEDEEGERRVRSKQDTPYLKKRALKKINNSKLQGIQEKTISFTKIQKTTKAKLAVLKPSDYEYDGWASYAVGKFKCTRCGRRFIYSAFLIDHVNWHTGDKSLQCTFCKKSFTRRDNLTHHQRHSCKGAAAAKLKKDHGRMDIEKR